MHIFLFSTNVCFHSEDASSTEPLWSTLETGKKKVAKNNENKKTAKKRDILAPIGIKRKNFID